MSKDMKEIQRLLKATGAVLLRNKRHAVYKLPNGKRFVLACSPSDHRGCKNALSDLRKLIG